MTEKIVSKVLVLDERPEHHERIRRVCANNDLVGLKAHRSNLMAVLKSNIDLGAILYAENFAGSAEGDAETAQAIHAARPELPIILCRQGHASYDGLAEGTARLFCAVFSIEDADKLRDIIREYIFSVSYPNALVRGILEITESALRGQFPNATVACDTPHIVRDRIIFGEVFSLIPLESRWCRGYMMLQTGEDAVLRLLDRDPAFPPSDFREVNSLLGEITNLIWGAFKNRFIGDDEAIPERQVQIPLVVNHRHKYISFGTETPQLCFCHTLTDKSSGQTVELFQRFAFNLSWSPEEFREIGADADAMVGAGELELF